MRGRHFHDVRRRLHRQKRDGVIESGIDVGARGVDDLPIVLRGAFAGRRIGVFEDAGRLLGGFLGPLVRGLGLGNALLRDRPQGVAQAEAAYERAKEAAEQATGVLEHSYAAASEGAAEYNRQVIDAARANVNAGFDYAIALLAVKSPTDVVELSTAHAREQFQALTEQAKALGALVQKLAAETAEPIQAGVTKAFQNAA